MFKKTFITLLIIFILTNQTTFSYQKAQASGFSLAAVPGYAKEVYAGMVTAGLAVTAAGMQTHAYVQENIELIREGAKSAYETLAPEAKASFLESLNAAGDRIVIAGDWITHALDSLKANEMKSEFTGNGTAFNFSYTVSGNVITVTANFTDGTTETVKLSNKYIYDLTGLYFTVTSNSISASIPSSYVAGHVFTGKTLAPAEESIYSQLDKRLRETDLPSGQLDNLRIPRSEAFTPTGQRLAVGEGGLTLDGIPYTGDISWRTTTDAGVNIPAPTLTIDGAPVYVLPDGTLIDSTGKAIPTDTVPNIGVTAPIIEWVDGVPFVVSPTNVNVKINILTGEIVGQIDIPGVENPPVPPVPGEFSPPTTAINWAPLKMNASALTKKFPFSIPWDFITQLKVFAVAPEAPKFEIDIPNYFTIDGQTQSMNWTLDFKDFDPIGSMIRWFILIIFDIGLILAIRKLLPE